MTKRCSCNFTCNILNVKKRLLFIIKNNILMRKYKIERFFNIGKRLPILFLKRLNVVVM